MTEYLGSLFSIPDLRDYVAKTTTTEFPETFELSMPNVKNQGPVGSCVAHAIATVCEFFAKQETGNVHKLSTGYIYGNRLLSIHKGSGMYVRDALKTMTKFGDVSYESFPQNVEVPYAIDLFDKCYASKEFEAEASQFRFERYFRLKDADSIKASLLENRPVIMSMWWYDDIKLVKGVMKTDLVKSKNTGGHCMVIYGWNEQGWKVQNSWGSSWGNKGRFTLPYDVPLKETWGVTDAVSDSSLEIKKPFTSKFGAMFASIFHTIISYFYNLKYNKE